MDGQCSGVGDKRGRADGRAVLSAGDVAVSHGQVCARARRRGAHGERRCDERQEWLGECIQAGLCGDISVDVTALILESVRVNTIDRVVLATLEERDLGEWLGIASRGHRRRVMHVITELVGPPVSAAVSAVPPPYGGPAPSQQTSADNILLSDIANNVLATSFPDEHEERLEYGDNAGEIAADNMAATFASMENGAGGMAMGGWATGACVGQAGGSGIGACASAGGVGGGMGGGLFASALLPQQQPQDELRIDEQDGIPYPRWSFIQCYGEHEGQLRWSRSRVSPPLPCFASYGQPRCAQQPHGPLEYYAQQQALVQADPPPSMFRQQLTLKQENDQRRWHLGEEAGVSTGGSTVRMHAAVGWQLLGLF